jgi:hypothetical protein
MTWIAATMATACAGGGCGQDARDAAAGQDQSAVTEICYFGPDKQVPAATVQHVLEVVAGVQVVHVRLTLDPRFVDNTYGATAVGWPAKGHKLKDLVGSDHARFHLFDGAGVEVLAFDLDYFSADPTTPSGYGTLGVTGGDGAMLIGPPEVVVGASTSMARNFNERALAGYTVDSPATDAAYTPNPAAAAWDYRVIYEFDVRLDAFGPSGFGAVTIDEIHASPSKLGENTVVVEPLPCPPDWDGYCDDDDPCAPDDAPPATCREDGDCAYAELCEDGTCKPVIP